MSANDPAFSVVFSDDSFHKGLTKREYAAIHFANGLVAKYNLTEPGDQTIISKIAVELADSLFTELNK